MPDNTALQFSVLKRLWRRQFAADPPTLTEAGLLATAAGAGAVMEEAAEVVSVSCDGASTQATIKYPMKSWISVLLT